MVELDEIGFTDGIGLTGGSDWLSASSASGVLLLACVSASVRHWSREETAEFRTARVQSETGRTGVELVLLARGEVPRARPRYWFWRRRALRDSRLGVRHREQAWPAENWLDLRASGPPVAATRVQRLLALVLTERPSQRDVCCRLLPRRTARPIERGGSQLTLSVTGWPTCACSRQAPSPRLRRSSGPCC
jgi:hypothetical protein